MTQSYGRDAVGRLNGAGAAGAGLTLRSVDYQLDDLDRRAEGVLNDGTKWDYDYNAKSEVTAAKRKFNSGAFVGGQQFEYAFDDIGNRTQTKSGGDAAGANLQVSSYGDANALNELTTRTVPGVAGVTGKAPAALSLQGFANSQPFSLTKQEDDYFFGEAAVNNSAWDVYAKVKVVAKNGAQVDDLVSGSKFVARSPESFIYDADGNLTQDSRWIYTWDAENRLTAMEARAEAVSAGAPKVRLVFGYDGGGRRFKKEVYVWNFTTSAYALQQSLRFVYEGWNLIGELNASLTPVRLYTWGLDVSGSMQGAGGVGGLLMMKTASDAFYYTFDGNGNVQQLVNATTATIAADYEYGPFGEPLRATGALAKVNPFRFSTKYEDNETGLLYYGYRYYTPSTGRWLNRDRIEEKGGLNVYSFNYNEPTRWIDVLGSAPADTQDFSCIKSGPLTANNKSRDEFDAGGPYAGQHFTDWGDGGNNCDSYGCNTPGVRTIQGMTDGIDQSKLDCAMIKTWIKEGKISGVVEPDGDCCPEGYHRIHIRVGDVKNHLLKMRDYHAYRQNSNGSWSHLIAEAQFPGGKKPQPTFDDAGNEAGLHVPTKICDTDAKGKKLPADPTKADHNYRNINYNEDCGIFCAKTR